MARPIPLRRLATGLVRRVLVGPGQRWQFDAPPRGWMPPPIDRTSLYLHVPFCRHACPYCPYTKVRYDEALLDGFTNAALSEVDWWAQAAGPCEITSIYVGGGTPTLALESVARVVDRVRSRFKVSGDLAIETSPADLDEAAVSRLKQMGVALVSLGVQSFQDAHLKAIGRSYGPRTAEGALELLASAGFASVNADLMFALPGQSAADLVADLDRAADLGASQVTAYPLFTFPYTPVGRAPGISASARAPGPICRAGSPSTASTTRRGCRRCATGGRRSPSGCRSRRNSPAGGGCTGACTTRASRSTNSATR